MKIDFSKLDWVKDGDYPVTFNGMVKDRRVAWIHKRPLYCNRGHWQANIDLHIELNNQDRFPRYFMELETAKKEIELFLQWRVNKIRAETSEKFQATNPNQTK